MKRSRRGDDFEVRIIEWLQEHLWVAASRRRIAGPGDVLAIRDGVILLIECKTTAAGPLADFVPEERRALIALAALIGAVPMLVWKPPRGRTRWFRLSDPLPSRAECSSLSLDTLLSSLPSAAPGLSLTASTVSDVTATPKRN